MCISCTFSYEQIKMMMNDFIVNQSIKYFTTAENLTGNQFNLPHDLRNKKMQKKTKKTTQTPPVMWLRRDNWYIISSLEVRLLQLWYVERPNPSKARFPLPELTARVNGPSWRVMETGNRFPLSVNTGRQLGEWKPVTRQLGPLTRAVNSGSGNRA